MPGRPNNMRLIDRIERERSRSAHPPPPVTYSDFAGLLWLALIAFVLGLGLATYGHVFDSAIPEHDANGCSPEQALSTICPGILMEQEYVVGKTCECLLGPTVRTQAPSFGAVEGWQAGDVAELLKIAQSTVPESGDTSFKSKSGNRLLSKPECVTVYEDIVEKIGSTMSATRYQQLHKCGLRALQRLSPQPHQNKADQASLAAIVEHVASEFASRTAFHVNVLCSVVDTPMLWEHARNSLQEAVESDDITSIPGEQCSDFNATTSCQPASWFACSNATASQRSLLARTSAPSKKTLVSASELLLLQTSPATMYVCVRIRIFAGHCLSLCLRVCEQRLAASPQAHPVLLASQLADTTSQLPILPILLPLL